MEHEEATKDIRLRVRQSVHEQWNAEAERHNLPLASYLTYIVSAHMNAEIKKNTPKASVGRPAKEKPVKHPSLTHPNSVGPDGIQRQEGMTYQEHVDDGWEDQWVGDIPDNWG